MVEFRMKLAGTVIGVQANCEYTREYCKNYLTEDEPDFQISMTPETLISERKHTINTAISTGRPPKGISSDEAMEIQALSRRVFEGLLDYDVLMIHGSAISVDEEAYLFSAPSGTGKSNHTSNWMEMLGGENNGRSFIINDDKPLLRFTEKGIYVCGSPWAGKRGTNCDASVPLKVFCLLRRSKENYVKTLSPEEAFPLFWEDIYHPMDTKRMDKTLKLVYKLLDTAVLYRLYCTAGLEAVQTAFDTMVLNKKL